MQFGRESFCTQAPCRRRGTGSHEILVKIRRLETVVDMLRTGGKNRERVCVKQTRSTPEPLEIYTKAAKKKGLHGGENEVYLSLEIAYLTGKT